MIVICEQVGVARASRDPFRIFFGEENQRKMNCRAAAEERDTAVTLSARLPAGMIAIKRRMMPLACCCVCVNCHFFVDFVSLNFLSIELSRKFEKNEKAICFICSCANYRHFGYANELLMN